MIKPANAHPDLIPTLFTVRTDKCPALQRLHGRSVWINANQRVATGPVTQIVTP